MKNNKFLLYDIETSPIISYNWGIWEQNAIEVIEDWQILCFAYKWLGEKKTHVVAQDDFRDYRPGVNNDKNVCKALWKLFDEADVIIGHNSMSFDDKKSNARFIQHGLTRPSPFIQEDTKRMAKKHFAFTSNKLSDLAKYLKVEDKGSPGGFETWKKCVAGEKKAWATMKKYNKQDVVVTEQIYLKLRGWGTKAPANIFMDVPDGCVVCAGTNLQARGFATNKTGRYRRYQCMDCGSWCRGRNHQKLYNDYVS
jgi:hypothetical protein